MPVYGVQISTCSLNYTGKVLLKKLLILGENFGKVLEILSLEHVSINIYYYYSFKIFPQFCLAKSTRIIPHNQLLMTKFGRILTLTRK